MAGPYSLTTSLFVALVLLMAILVAWALRRASVRGGRPRSALLAIALFLAVYLALPAALALAGALNRYDPLPAPALLVLLGLTVVTVGVALSPIGASLATSLPLAVLVGYQAFRIPVEWALHRWYEEGVVPIEMSYAGRNFDIVSGATAALLGAWLLRNPRAPRAVLLVWNLVGLGLLVNIVAVAVLATPTPFRQFTSGPPNLVPSTFPFVWLPSFLVQLALIGHLLVFRRLRAARSD
jgi:hypothetical protein